MTEPLDPKVAFISMVKEHIDSNAIKEIAKLLIADQCVGFWDAPFSGGQNRWDGKGGLAEAMLYGYRAFRILNTTASTLYTSVDTNRMLAIYLSLMIGRWANIRDLKHTFNRDNPASATSVGVANAIAFGLDLSPKEVQALTRWYSSRLEMSRDYEGFSPEWWVLSETMNWIFVANRK